MFTIQNKSDLELLLAWRKGESAMGEELYRRHKTAVTNLLRRNVRSQEEVLDLVQQTFLSCVAGEKDPVIAGSVRSYLLGIAFHTMTRFFRRERNAPSLGLDLETSATLASIEPDPEYLLTLSEQRRLLMKAIRRLKIEFQAVIELSYWEQIPCDDIAEILSVPRGTVRSRLKHGRMALEKKLTELTDSRALLAETTMSINAWQAQVRAWIDARPGSMRTPSPE